MAEEYDLEGDLEEDARHPLAAAQASREQDRPAEAVRLLKELTRREPGNAAAFQELAAAHCDLNQHREAVQAARRALELDPHLYRPHGVLSWVALKQGRNEEAEAELLAQLQTIPPEHAARQAAVHTQLGFVQFRQKRYDDAEASWRQACSLDPAEELPRFNLSRLYLATKRQEEAIGELEQMMALPDLSEGMAYRVHLDLGQLYARQGRYADARAQFDLALALRRTFVGTVYRTVPLLARFPLYVLLVVLLIVALILWNLFLRR